MPSLDIAYTSESATDLVVGPNAEPGIQWYQSGGSKGVRKIQVNIAYTYGAEQEVEWHKRFLRYWEIDQTKITNVDLMEAKTKDEVGVGDNHNASS
jgi:hypothetical protein